MTVGFAWRRAYGLSIDFVTARYADRINPEDPSADHLLSISSSQVPTEFLELFFAAVFFAAGRHGSKKKIRKIKQHGSTGRGTQNTEGKGWVFKRL